MMFFKKRKAKRAVCGGSDPLTSGISNSAKSDRNLEKNSERSGQESVYLTAIGATSQTTDPYWLTPLPHRPGPLDAPLQRRSRTPYTAEVTVTGYEFRVLSPPLPPEVKMESKTSSLLPTFLELFSFFSWLRCCPTVTGGNRCWK